MACGPKTALPVTSVHKQGSSLIGPRTEKEASSLLMNPFLHETTLLQVSELGEWGLQSQLASNSNQLWSTLDDLKLKVQESGQVLDSRTFPSPSDLIKLEGMGFTSRTAREGGTRTWQDKPRR